MAVYLPNISSVHAKCDLMSSIIRLDIASHSISLITIDFYKGLDNSNFLLILIQIFVTDIKI